MDKFEKQQKFWAAMAFFFMNCIYCGLVKVDGTVYQAVAVAIVVSFLGSQAVVEWKQNK